MLRRRSLLVYAVIALALLSAAVARAFTATQSASRVISRMRVEARRLTAVRTERSGALVYCRSVPDGWTFAPQAGCRVRARVTEEYDLSGGRIKRVIGHVTASGRPEFTYVNDSSGWYRSVAGTRCWTRELRGFTAPALVDYPLPGELVSLLTRTRTRIVLRAVARSEGYEQLDYVNPTTFFDYRDVEITHRGRKAYRVYDASTPLPTRTRRPSTTPACGHA